MVFPLHSKNLNATHTPKFLNIPNFCCGCFEEKKFANLVFPPLRGLIFWVGKIAHALEGSDNSNKNCINTWHLQRRSVRPAYLDEINTKQKIFPRTLRKRFLTQLKLVSGSTHLCQGYLYENGLLKPFIAVPPALNFQ